MPGNVERFFPDPKEQAMVAAIRETFTNLWGLSNSDDAETKRIIQVNHQRDFCTFLMTSK